ncbi:MAG TPA: methyltransferase, partial [Kofleriaceae bacterium]|nr:methyltransferase [Kofleriaceae bacterium]
DPELERRRRRGLLMIDRDADDGEPSEVALDVAPPAPVPMIARCRPGLETILAGELFDLGLDAHRFGPGAVAFDLDRGLGVAWQARTMLSAGALVPLAAGELGPAIVAALTAPATVALLTAWTRGPIRWRLDVEGAGHRRALAWDVAGAVAERAPALRNRPRATTWDVVVTGGDRWLELRPRRLDDHRFDWRVADVPAASHPTVAAALVRVAGARDGEQVWDPFVGSGAELCERGRLGPCTLRGSDLDARALAAARANLTAAGLVDRAVLVEGDALQVALPRIDLVITNPPMGRRLRGDVAPLLSGLAIRLPSVLARGGRLVWLNPRTAVTTPILGRGGLTLTYARDVELGGYEARLERWDR